MKYVFPPSGPSTIAIRGTGQLFPVHRIYCVGRNYAAHAREMGKDPDREPPFFFCKPADAVVANHATIPYPSRTSNLHHEVELVVTIGQGGKNILPADALDHVFGYAVGNDLTRRDLQNDLKNKGHPWETGKGFDHSAPVSAIQPARSKAFNHARIWLTVNGQLRQEANTADLIWGVPDILSELSALFELCPGDVIFTGTPAGVGAVKAGDRIEAGIDGLETLITTIADLAHGTHR
jgi:fumarylpyruvate hydrolase